MGDNRTYEYLCLLRAITSEDGMTADFYEFKKAFIQTISNKIVNNLGEEIPALPIPIDKQFRKEKVSDAVPKLGNTNDQFL